MLLHKFEHENLKGIALAKELGISRAAVYKILKECKVPVSISR